MSQISVPPDAPDSATVEISTWCIYIYHEWMGKNPTTSFKVIVDALRNVTKIRSTSLDIKGVYRVCFDAVVPYESLRWFGSAVASALTLGAMRWRSWPGKIYIHYYANNKEIEKVWYTTDKSSITSVMEELDHNISQHLGKSLHPAQQRAPQQQTPQAQPQPQPQTQAPTQAQPQVPAQTSTSDRFKLFKRKKPADTTQQQQTETRPAPYSGDDYPMYGEEDSPDRSYSAIVSSLQKWMYQLNNAEHMLNRLEELITDPRRAIPVKDLIQIAASVKEAYNMMIDERNIDNVNYIQAIVATNPNLDPRTHEVFVNYIESVRAFMDRAEAVMQELSAKIYSSRSEQVKKKVGRI